MAYLKLDLKVNNPKKLYRKIFDVCEDEISSRGYRLEHKDTFKPFLKENALYNVADFFGRITIYRDIFSIKLDSEINKFLSDKDGEDVEIFPFFSEPFLSVTIVYQINN